MVWEAWEGCLEGKPDIRSTTVVATVLRSMTAHARAGTCLFQKRAGPISLNKAPLPPILAHQSNVPC